MAGLVGCRFQTEWSGVSGCRQVSDEILVPIHLGLDVRLVDSDKRERTAGGEFSTASRIQANSGSARSSPGRPRSRVRILPDEGGSHLDTNVSRGREWRCRSNLGRPRRHRANKAGKAGYRCSRRLPILREQECELHALAAGG